jgi:hypothetical protein
VVGNVAIDKVKLRGDEMYAYKTNLPEYKPKFGLTEKKSPKMVNYGVLKMKDVRRVINLSMDNGPPLKTIGKIKLLKST